MDQEQFNLTPFPIFIRKAPVFLENTGIFDFDIGDQDKLFSAARLASLRYRKRVPVNGGAKLTGAVGRLQFR